MDEKIRILLIEDDPMISDILTSLIRTWGYECFLAGDGHKALSALRRVFPSLIILDTQLPDMSGFTLTGLIKEDIFTSHIPVILLVEKKQMRKKMLSLQSGIDDYIMKPPDPIDLEVRIEMTLRRTEHHFHASSLTRLPGARALEKEIRHRLLSGKPFSVCYFDIDHFKSFNDKYGYIKGDGVINQTAHIISTVVRTFGSGDDLVGHIGGDDFMAITHPQCDERIAKEVIAEFDRLTPLHYDRADRQKGTIAMLNRQGKEMDFPLMSISIAIVNSQNKKVATVAEISERTAEIKRYLKHHAGSGYLIDRRSEGDQKSGGEKAAKVCRGRRPFAQIARSERRDLFPLGQHLLKKEVLSTEQLEEALQHHWRTGLPLGETVLLLGLVDMKQLGGILGEQLGVPYLGDGNYEHDKEFVNAFPKELLVKFHVIPLRKVDGVAHVAMTDPTNEEILDALKKDMQLPIQPYLAFEYEWETMFQEIVSHANN
ncbi:MAG: response regulator [Candidatus Omnitrophica bacterium]|nr:response regulator [Candidatus Omnitrophota bacterium]